MEREATTAAYKFEERVKIGFKADSRLTFEEYAAYVLDLKEQTGVRPTTLERYLGMMPTINEAIGHLQLTSIRPERLNDFYEELKKTKNKKGAKARATRNLMNLLDEKGISKVRALKLAPQCVELLKEWKLEQMRMRLKKGPDWKETGMVFTKENGEWLHPDSITRWLNNFSRDNSLPHIHPHAFRHTAASTMIANGVDLVTTANELGHANATTTAMIYAHQIAIAKARAADVRAGVFAGRDSKPKGSKLRSKFRGA